MSDAKSFKDKGNAAFKDGKWTEAIEAYTEAIKLDPGNQVFYSNRSAAYLKAGEIDKALADANKCIELKPDFHKGYGRKGAALHAMKKYDEAIDAYNAGLKISPNEEHLKLGLSAAKRAKMDSKPAARAARKSVATQRASRSKSMRVKKAPTVSAFVQQTRLELKLQMLAIQAQLDLIEQLAAMTDDEKLDLLFTLVDRDGDGKIDARELAVSMRKRNEELTFGESIERAINMVAVFDTDGDYKLDNEEFATFMRTMTKELGIDFHEFAEFLVLQLAFTDNQNTLEEELVGQLAKAEISDAVKDQQELFDMLIDPRMIQLFKLFDKDGTRELSFKEVAIGLYQLTDNMEESVKMTMELLLMVDEEDSRTLNYEAFGRLILAIVAAADTTFDEVADDLTLCMTQNDTVTASDLANLIVGEEIYAAAKDLENDIKEEAAIVDALAYGRLQKLFDLWDKDSDGKISFNELALGLRKFQTAIDGKDNPDLQAIALLGFDEDGDEKLDPKEFATAMLHFARASNVEVHELIDFMCVTALADDKPAYREAYRQSMSGANMPGVQAVYLEYYEEPQDEDFFM